MAGSKDSQIASSAAIFSGMLACSVSLRGSHLKHCLPLLVSFSQELTEEIGGISVELHKLSK